MKRPFKLLLICFTLFATSVFAQETVCNNYLDDDGDGFIDCFDSDCANNATCAGFYVGNDVACQPPTLPSNKFTMARDFASPNETTNHLSRMAIGDLNRDGIPEIITMNRYTKRVFILNGNDGTIQSQATVTWEPQWEIAIANINNDACGEIFFFGVESGNNYLYAYDCNLNFIWRSAQKLRGDPINFGVADFDSDGKVEIYVKDEIFDAHTGIRIVKSTAPSWSKQNGGPVAVDMDNDTKLDLVIGLKIFKVNLGARTADAGSLTLMKSVPTYFIRYEYNATSVADYNLDGNLDVIASGSTIADGTNTTVFFWDVTANTVKTYSDPIPGSVTLAGCPPSTGSYYQNGWTNGTGRINLSDLDGDGKMNASYVSGKYLYALKEDFTLLWRVVVNEETSGYTGCTLFDFNGDGKSEIVYRDEKFLYIINGFDGSVNTQQACVSRTNREYPIVADVDADGSTEICVTCGFDDALAVANFCNINYSQYSHVRVFKSATEPWVPARRLWNQHGYYNVNVNNDLTIPRVQQKHHLPFAGVPCTGFTTIPRPLNSFLNQSPFLDSKGCQVFTAPDLGFVSGSLTVNSPTCPDNNFTVSFSVINNGDAPISGNVPVTFYNGDPNAVGAIKLNTTTMTLPTLTLNQTFAVNNLTVTGPGTSFELYIVLNDDGSSVPTPIKLNPNFLECNYINNVEHATVTPLPVAITALKISDNIVCSPSPSPPNGAVSASIAGNTIDYNFYWSNGLVAKAIPADFVGPIYSGLAGGDYTVYAVHKTANCGSDTTIVSPQVTDSNRILDVSIDLLKPDDNCQNPNGQLRAYVNKATVPGGEPAGNFTYEWYVGPTVGGGQVVGNSHIASNLVGGINPYTVLVTEKSTGCSNSFSLAVPDLTAKPVVQVSVTDILCSNGNSGSAAATVGGVTTGFKFEWYKGSFVKPTTDFPGPPLNTGVISSLSAGTYTVVAKNQTSQCVSDPVTVTVVQTPAFVVTATKTSDQTSCDMSQLNGAVAADVAGDTTAFTFEWFKGQNTLLANRISTFSKKSGLDFGVYTVKVTNPLTGCSDTEEVTINFAVVTPSLLLAATGGITNCTTPDGSVKVTVSLDKASDYTFSWYDGASVKATPDYPDTDSLLTGLPVGTYTVQAVHKTKHCATGPITANVVDNTPIISITLDALITQPPSDCNSNNGVMKVDVSAPGNVSGFKIEWYAGVPPLITPPLLTSNGVTSSTANALGSGIYTVVATNLDNGCSRNQSFNLPFLNAHLLNYVSQIDVDKCSPTNIGRITVDLIKSIDKPGSTFFESDYFIELRSGTTSAGGLIQTINGVNGQIPYTTVNTLTPGFYNLVAISNNVSTPGCKSVPVIVEIKQVTSNPVIAASSISNNTNCSGPVAANGQIQLDIDGPALESDYTYVWHNGPNVSSPVLGAFTTQTASNLPSGSYTVEVTKTAGSFQGCSSVATFQIFDNPPIITLASGDITVTDHLRCDINTGDATINTISETVNGVTSAVSTATYTFEWFDANLVSLQNGPASSISNLLPGTYFVQATSTTNNCAGTMLSFEIKDQTLGDQLNLISFTSPTRCLKPANDLGVLQVKAEDIALNPATVFTYEWYAGPVVAGAPIAVPAPGDVLSGITVPIGQPDVTFTVRANNQTTTCITAPTTFVVPVVTAPILLTASAGAVTFCAVPYDGSVFATITSGSQAQYDYNWYDETVKAAPDFVSVVGTPFTPLDSGNYIVIAIDQLDVTCFASDTVTITNDRVYPTLLAKSLRSLSSCDLAVLAADGVAEASIQGEDIIKYKIDWYRDDLPPTGRQFASGSQAGGLADSTYYVVASNLVTSCSDSTSVTIPFAPLPIPFPSIKIISMKTSCVENNGALSASVNGNTKDYVFDWYSGKVAGTNYISSGEIIDSLAIGFYTVTATSRITGCTSIGVTEEIKEQTLFPDFNFKVEPATCDQPDGFLTLFMTTTDLQIASIEWTAPDGSIITGPNVMNAPAGIYSVTVTTGLGCATSKTIELLTEIRPYNGVSVNGDSKNPIFQIDCIQNFPNNVVKIFNRAGTLVYEASGYDNQITFFDGKSNKGISLMGTQLPGGTYFYVIDKRDGSKALAGYLEVVN